MVGERMSVHRLKVVLLGVGGVGRALLRQIAAERGHHASRLALALEIIAVADSTALVTAAEHGLSDEALATLITLKEAGGNLAQQTSAHAVTEPLQALHALGDRLAPGTVVVDCTATDKTLPALLYALDRGCKLVLANKKPLTMQQEAYARLTRAGATTGALQPGCVRWETTCGAALPVITTLNRLLACGDHVRRIAGTFSGTLGYVMTGLQAGRAFSAVVREAHALGYTEPDPRDDLGGVDVARKALILGRGLGWQLELDDVVVEGLHPARMNSLSVSDFLAALAELDALFAAKVTAAKAEGKVLRYAATVQDGRCRVGPTLVDADSPLGRLAGVDNLIEFHTHWYDPNPLVVQGRGAGVEITASGVLSDLVELAFTIDTTER